MVSSVYWPTLLQGGVLFRLHRPTTVLRHIDISRPGMERNIFPLAETVKPECEVSPRARPCCRLNIYCNVH